MQYEKPSCNAPIVDHVSNKLQGVMKYNLPNKHTPIVQAHYRCVLRVCFAAITRYVATTPNNISVVCRQQSTQ